MYYHGEIMGGVLTASSRGLKREVKFLQHISDIICLPKMTLSPEFSYSLLILRHHHHDTQLRARHHPALIQAFPALFHIVLILRTSDCPDKCDLEERTGNRGLVQWVIGCVQGSMQDRLVRSRRWRTKPQLGVAVQCWQVVWETTAVGRELQREVRHVHIPSPDSIPTTTTTSAFHPAS
ncbi:hypothetical protein BDN72DRAFT_678447 [Pluteus cervinus]|uniref:Uncharacterized protein n=1 Tax=Pluteus cervinus TaxID=181527 RepID=A0ACD3ASE9_9AGAR|nr:hypothetical protein BDN72DRAFT_678447 [Pluteus cervinus]